MNTSPSSHLGPAGRFALTVRCIQKRDARGGRERRDESGEKLAGRKESETQQRGEERARYVEIATEVGREVGERFRLFRVFFLPSYGISRVAISDFAPLRLPVLLPPSPSPLPFAVSYTHLHVQIGSCKASGAPFPGEFLSPSVSSRVQL